MSTANAPTPAHSDGQTVASLVESGAATGTWALDPAATQVEFRSTSMWGMAKIHGWFTAVSGTGTVGPDGTVTGQLTIDASSLDTKNKKRDKHLRTKDFFDVTQHPTITYVAERISPLEANRAEVQGVLTVRGQQRALPFEVTATEVTDGAVTVTAELDVDRSLFGMTWSPLKVASLTNRVTVTARFQRADG